MDDVPQLPAWNRSGTGKSALAFRTISEVSHEIDVPQHVLRFWESKFSQVKPMKRGGGRRHYRPEDVELLRSIRDLLRTDGYTIKGVQKLLRESGVKAITGRRKADGTARQPETNSRDGAAPATEAAPTPSGEANTAEVEVLRAALVELLEELEQIGMRLRNALE